MKHSMTFRVDMTNDNGLRFQVIVKAESDRHAVEVAMRRWIMLK